MLVCARNTCVCLVSDAFFRLSSRAAVAETRPQSFREIRDGFGEVPAMHPRCMPALPCLLPWLVFAFCVNIQRYDSATVVGYLGQHLLLWIGLGPYVQTIAHVNVRGRARPNGRCGLSEEHVHQHTCADSLLVVILPEKRTPRCGAGILHSQNLSAGSRMHPTGRRRNGPNALPRHRIGRLRTSVTQIRTLRLPHGTECQAGVERL